MLPFSFPGGEKKKQKVDLHNLFLGIAMDPVSPF